MTAPWMERVYRRPVRGFLRGTVVARWAEDATGDLVMLDLVLMPLGEVMRLWRVNLVRTLVTTVLLKRPPVGLFLESTLTVLDVFVLRARMAVARAIAGMLLWP